MHVEHFLVPGLVGQQAVRTISAALSALPGVLLVSVNLSSKRVRVEHDGRTSVEALMRALNSVGYAEVALLA